MTVPLEVGRNEVWTTIDVTADHTCDIHYQSTNMATKSRAPNFYTEGSP